MSMRLRQEIQTMSRQAHLKHSSFTTAQRYFRTLMVTYILYAPILHAKMPCSVAKSKRINQTSLIWSL